MLFGDPMGHQASTMSPHNWRDNFRFGVCLATPRGKRGTGGSYAVRCKAMLLGPLGTGVHHAHSDVPRFEDVQDKRKFSVFLVSEILVMMKNKSPGMFMATPMLLIMVHSWAFAHLRLRHCTKAPSSTLVTTSCPHLSCQDNLLR